MCLFVLLATPLTLSEVRSMLAAGLAAHTEDSETQRLFRSRWPRFQTVVSITHGACSCDLVLPRHPVSREDEARLRTRYRAMGLARGHILAALERHRRAAGEVPQPAGYWARMLAEFVAEHARNAGPSIYLLHFSPTARLAALPHSEPITLTAGEVRSNPSGWLPEGQMVEIRS
ncbi:MAG TPA: hypothetical protein VJN95_15835 [Gemmatimonadales bacterium]|nr:hypothetical protein [Gemmatimonadales bacterium]